LAKTDLNYATYDDFLDITVASTVTGWDLQFQQDNIQNFGAVYLDVRSNLIIFAAVTGPKLTSTTNVLDDSLRLYCGENTGDFYSMDGYVNNKLEDHSYANTYDIDSRSWSSSYKLSQYIDGKDEPRDYSTTLTFSAMGTV